MPIEWTPDRIVNFIAGVEASGIDLNAPQQYVEAFQILINSGLAFQLGRVFSDEASRLIDLKLCTPPHKIFCIGCID